jgi:chitinase
MTNAVLAGYYMSSSIYARSYHIRDIPSHQLNHIIYAFAKVDQDGSVSMPDAWADTDMRHDTEEEHETGRILHGNLGELVKLKRTHRAVQVTLSIGGWTYSNHFSGVCADPEKRARFVETSIKLVEDFGLDGIDIDWEFPGSLEDGENYVALLSDLRRGLDRYQAEKGDPQPYLLSSAVPCEVHNCSKLKLAEMVPLLDLFYIMAYNFTGSWVDTVDHQANLFGGRNSIAQIVDDYVLHGVPENKIVIGCPAYGRCFQNTLGIGHPFDGVGKGTWEEGVYDYKQLPLPGGQIHIDMGCVASFTYDPAKRELVSYDEPVIVERKAQWCMERGLRGIMFWELSGDHPDPERSLVSAALRGLGGMDALEKTENHLHFPNSEYDNVRAASTE